MTTPSQDQLGLALPNPLTIARGGTGAQTAAAALAALGGAAAGANNDITALNALTAAAAFTPTVTFATPGDLSVSYATQTGTFYRIGKLVFFFVSLVFTPTYSSASGVLRVSLPLQGAAGVAGPLQILQLTGSTAVTWPGATGTMIYGQAMAGQSYAQVFGAKSGAAPAALIASQLASGNQITLTLAGVYLAA